MSQLSLKQVNEYLAKARAYTDSGDLLRALKYYVLIDAYLTSGEAPLPVHWEPALLTTEAEMHRQEMEES